MSHNHDHSHHHHHAATGNIRIAFFLNLGFTLVEITGGIMFNSTAILADAVHDLGDSIALAQAWYFEKKSQQKGDRRYTYGYRRFSLLGAITSTLILLLSSAYVLSEALPRLLHPEQPDASGMIVIAVFGVLVNSAILLKLSRESSMNARSVMLHMMEDVLGWAAVLVSAIVMRFADLPILDPALALVISFWILYNVIRNIRQMLPVLLQAAPEHIDIDAVTRELTELPPVSSAHHAHLWSTDGTHAVFSIHLTMEHTPDTTEYLQLKKDVRQVIEKHDIDHSTVEIEFPEEPCRIGPGNNCR